VGISDVFRDKVTGKKNKFSLLEPVTGNFNSLMSRKTSLFFVSLDGPQGRAKRRELCRMPYGAMREREPKTSKSPVKFPVSREMQPERGSLVTASTTKQPFTNQAYAGRL